MSKMIEALRKTECEAASLTFEVLRESAEPRSGGPGSGSSEKASARPSPPLPETSAPTRPKPEDESESWVEEAVTNALTTVETAAPIAAPTASSQHSALLDNATSRSVELRLPAVSPLLPFDSGDGAIPAEQYRRIRTRILQHHLDPQLLLVSSPGQGDGKSVTSINTAGALALNGGATVLLVDVDLRRPSIASFLGVPEAPGVGEILAGSCGIDDAIVNAQGFPGLYLIPAGSNLSNPTEMFSSSRWKDLCAELRSRATYTILDGPPVDSVAEYKLLEEASDALILVVRINHTARPLLTRALDSIPDSKLVGITINQHRDPLLGQPGDYYFNYADEQDRKDVP